MSDVIPNLPTQGLENTLDRKFVVVGADCGQICKSIAWKEISQVNLVDYHVVILVARNFGTAISSLNYDTLGEVRQRLRRMLVSGGQLVVVTGPSTTAQVNRSLVHKNKVQIDLDILLPLTVKFHTERGTTIETKNENQFSRYLSKLKHWNFWMEPASDTESIPFLNNREDRPLAGTFSKGKIQITILPDIAGYETDEIGREILHSFGLLGDAVPAPDWANDISVPGIADVASQIEKLESEIEEVTGRLDKLNADRGVLEQYRKLLYSMGDDLEAIVAEVLKKLGALMLDEKHRDEDLLFKIDDQTCVVEITGTEAPLKLRKVRQLFNHAFDVEEKTGDRPKGILIANPLRLVPPEFRGKSKSPEVPLNVATRAEEMKLSIVLGQWLFRKFCDFLEGTIDGESVLREIVSTDGVVTLPDTAEGED